MKRRSDGRYMKRIGSHCIYARSIRELNEKYKEYLLNNKPMNKSVTFNKLSDTWLTTKTNVTIRTLNNYKTLLRLHILPTLYNKKVNDITSNDIASIIMRLQYEGKNKTAKDTLVVIKSIIRYGMSLNIIQNDVTYNIRCKIIQKEYKKPLELNLVRMISISDDKEVFMYKFLLYTGLRRSELIPLQYRDIDLTNKTILINKAVEIVTNQPAIKDTKNHTARIVPILNPIYNELYEMKLRHKDNDYIFPNSKGQMMSNTSIRRKVEKINKKINQSITLHQLRHTYICLLYKSGISAKQCQSWTGHKDIRVLLDIYTHLDSIDNNNAVDKANQYLTTF